MFIIHFMNLISVHFWTYLEKLDDEGIIVPEEFRYFPYPATFDQLAQMLVDIQEGNEESSEEESEDESRDIDLMASDDQEDEEEIEPEIAPF